MIVVHALLMPPAHDGTCAHLQGDEEEDKEELEEAALDERDAETFDDGEFYQQLLKEFLESSGADTTAINASVQVRTLQFLAGHLNMYGCMSDIFHPLRHVSCW